MNRVNKNGIFDCDKINGRNLPLKQYLLRLIYEIENSFFVAHTIQRKLQLKDI